MKKLVLLFFLYVPFIVFSQLDGGVFVSDFELNNRAEKWCWAINQDDDNIMLLGIANGVVVFDGLNQNPIRLPFTPLALEKKEKSNTIIVSGYKKIGVLTQNGFANYQYKTIAEFDDTEFDKILFHNDTTYVLSESLIVRLSENLDKTDSIFIDGILNETFVIKNKLYFIIDYFLYTIEDGKLVENLTADFPVDEFAYTINLNENEVILGTNENTYYTFSGRSFKTKEIKNAPFFDNNMVVEGKLYNDSLIILSSLAGGIAIVDINKHKVIKQVSYFNGLADDEIRTFFIDKQNAIWASHEFGISRLDFNLGIENYSFYPGLKGNPIAVNYFENELYVATSDGLFKLSEIKNYDEFTVSVNIPVNVTVEVPVETTVIEERTTPKTSENEDKSLFGFLSKKKKNKSEQGSLSTKQVAKTVKTTEKKVVQKTRKKTIRKRSLKSVSHYFTLVKGITDKCTQMVPYNDYLLVAGNNGLYAVKRGKSSKILSAYIYDIYYTEKFAEAYVCTNNGIYKVYRLKGKWELDHFTQTTSTNILSIAYEKDDNWVLAVENMIVRVKLKDKKGEIIHQAELDEAAGMTFFAKNINNESKIFTSNAIYNFTEEGKLILDKEINSNSYFLANQSNYTWNYNNEEWFLLSDSPGMISKQQINKLRLYKELRYIDINKNGDIWIINEDNQVLKISKSKINPPPINLAVKEVKSDRSEFSVTNNILLPPSNNNLSVRLSAPYYFKQNGTSFRYKLENLHGSWSNWTNNPEVNINYIPPGNFNLLIQSTDNFGNKTELKEPIRIKVSKPFTQTAGFVLLIIIFVVLGAYAFFRIRLIKLKRDKEILEQKVKERTKTIEQQKSHIEKQHDEITQSIRYAKRIQTAMLPHDEIIEAMMPNHFILFMPRDIVSGDFYFFKPIGNKMVFVAADCTGHGVPGGFMSMLGISYLSEITSQIKDPTASEILNHLREKIKLTLGQTDVDSTQKDGMDLAICVIDSENNQLQFSGAFNPLYIIRNDELEIVKADRQPVAVYFKEHEFTNHIIDIKKGDIYYMFSDGFPDQIGGPKQRKFMTKNFKQLLIDNHTLPMLKQKEILQNTITEWQGDSMQVDDILVIGFQV